MEEERRISKALYFVLAGAAALGGLVGFVYLLYSGITGLGHDLIRVEAPGVREIMLARPGIYTVFLDMPEYAGETDTDPFELISGLAVRLESMAGRRVPIGPARGRSTYTIGGRRGVGIMEFKIETPGHYKFITSFAEGRPVHPTVLTMAQGFMSRIIQIILKAGSLFLGAALASALFLILAFTRGRKIKKAPPPGLPPPIG